MTINRFKCKYIININKIIIIFLRFKYLTLINVNNANSFNHQSIQIHSIYSVNIFIYNLRGISFVK